MASGIINSKNDISLVSATFSFTWDEEGEKSSIDKNEYRQLLKDNYKPEFDDCVHDIFHFIMHGNEK